MEEDDDEDPEEDPEEDLSEEHEPDDNDEDPAHDPNDEPEPEDEDTKEPYEDFDKTKPFEEDETAVTPPPPRHRGARISVRPQTPMATSTQALIDAFAARSSLFPLPPTSPAYDQASLGHMADMICRRDDILEEDMPPQRRFTFTAPPPRCDVAESYAAAARAPREDVGYVRALQASERRMMTSIEEVNLRDIRLEIDVGTEDLAVTQMMPIRALEARAQTDTVEDTNSSCIVSLSQWLKKMESVFHISGYAIDNQVNTNNNNNINQKAGACYEYGNIGYIKRNFPKLKNRRNGNGNGIDQGRAYALEGRDASPDSNVITCTFILNNRYAKILFDTGGIGALYLPPLVP
nr:hypothetical protein [Tanacetum cinerariifolium]